MKLARLNVEGFGQLKARELLLAPGLNLIFGPNEAGKSTLLAFIRAVLFGFERRGRPERYEPADGPFGGEILLSTHFGELWVRRVRGRRAEGEVTLRSALGDPLPPGRIGDALGGVSRELFYEVFAFGLDELSSFERFAEQGTVSEALFAAGMRGAHRLPLAVEALERSAEAIFTPRGQRRELNAVLQELADLKERIRAGGDLPLEHQAIQGRLAEIGRELAESEAGDAPIAREHDALVRLESALPELDELRAAEEVLGALPDLSTFPEAALARLEDLGKRLSDARGEREALKAKLAAVEEELGWLAAAAQEEPAGALRAAVDRFSARAEQFRALPSRRAALEERRRQVEATLRGLGLPLSADAVQKLELGGAVRAELAATRERIAAAERTVLHRADLWRTAQADRERVESEVRRLSAEVSRLPSTPAAVARRRRAALERVPSLRAEIARAAEQATARRSAREELRARKEAPPRSSFPGWALLVAGALVVAAAAIGFASGGVVSGAIASAGGMAALGILAVVRRWAEAAQREAMASFELRAAQRERELARLDAEVEALSAREVESAAALAEALALAGLDSASAGDPARFAQAAEALEEQLRQVERRERLSSEMEALSARLASAVQAERSAKADRDLAEAAVSKLQRELQALLAGRGLPAGVSAEAALELVAAAAAQQERLFDLGADERAYEADARACQEAAEAVLEAAARRGLSAESPEAAASALAGVLRQGQETEASRRRAAERRELFAAELAKAEHLCAELSGALEGLLSEGRCADVESFRAKAAAAARFAEARERAQALGQRIDARLGQSPKAAREQLVALGGPAGLVARIHGLGEALSQRAAARRAIAEERGRLQERLRALETDVQIAQLRLTEEALAERAFRLAERCAIDRIALALLSRARRRYEEEQQPRVIQLASATFAQLTGGRYVRAFTSPGRGPGLFIRDAHGREWSAEQLSRGAREQLYLAFRLAVIEDFGEARVPLPIVLDDILVNFDAERTGRTLEVLARISRRHQVIAFTCHPVLRERFAAQGAHLVELGAAEPRANFG